ncbi:amylo-alpha-1,6-glucosidase [Mycolicibacterium arabiense]|uniref:Amylo-alpha-1,6-glucosidase n=1 Tax=Mycolicibacterium arabiense TaxID=1286181 RepID=A0A7I7RV73_9MYCO|nr:glycogen debranching N-terminal domain-containing protein [Mycolicibacterium arabiense]MCV7373471.1 amylo-alpha-1,6-glucosidase [Mycolicibacterium arabiense]BBY48100.1 amylo-alpha-1,6-glucosidase [Mycolicibacterium arabiense]
MTIDGEEGAAGAWASGSGPPVAGDGVDVTLLEGSVFCVSSRSGDMQRDRPHGLFVSDTRILSCWRLTVDGAQMQSLSTVDEAAEPYRATFVGRTPPRQWLADSTMLVLRDRLVGDGMREEITLRNLGAEPVGVTLSLIVDTDFADLFAVKEGRVRPPHGMAIDIGTSSMTFTLAGPDITHTAQITGSGEPIVTPGRFTFRVVVPQRSQWSTCIEVEALTGCGRTELRHRCGEPVACSAPAQRLQAWRLSNPRVVTGDPALDRSIEVGTRDLGSLQIEDPRQPGNPILAAGAPWFMALFGRDSLLTAWMGLGLDPRLALNTLRTLARLQGTRTDPLTEEEPGRILHEVRLGTAAALALGGGTTYYGTADATPLFVMLLAELDRWGALPDADRPSLLAAADKALTWIREYGDADGDGFVEYQRHTDRGLVNQGWKDSFDGVNHADGHLAAPPIALCEVQGYVYAAFLGRAFLAETDGDTACADQWRSRAARLKAAFNRAFWMPERRAFATALDGAKRQVDAVTSNMGHCLWAGIVDDDKAAAVAAHLAGTSMNSGFGLRTLAADMGAYNPMSYHNGSVWPHDTAIAIAGLANYGFVNETRLLALDLIDASEYFGGRLPELFCGFSRADFSRPVPYPTSCSPQAWAAASSRLVLRSLLRFNPDVPHGQVHLSPMVPDRLLPICMENVPLAGTRMSVTVEANGTVDVRGLPEGVRLVTPRTSPPTRRHSSS